MSPQQYIIYLENKDSDKIFIKQNNSNIFNAFKSEVYTFGIYKDFILFVTIIINNNFTTFL